MVQSIPEPGQSGACDPVMNPAILKAAEPDNPYMVGTVYLEASVWIADSWLAQRFRDVGSLLRDRHVKKPAEGVQKAFRIPGLKRPELAQRYRDAASGLGDRCLPPGLTEWLATRLEAIAEAYEDRSLSRSRLDNSVLRACGAARLGRPGNRAADTKQIARDETLVWEVFCQRRADPAPEAELFERVARLWSEGTERVTAGMVQKAWKGRRRLVPELFPK